MSDPKVELKFDINTDKFEAGGNVKKEKAHRSK
jgi:hypothetical protein